jgi:hypothetical protein
MRARTKRFSLIGAAACLALVAGVVIAPASAPSASATVGCSYFKGLSVTANYVSVSAALNAGDTITVKVAPASTGDQVILSTSLGTSIYFADEPASTGLTFKAPYTKTYNLGFSFEAAGVRPSSLTYSFTATCSSTTVAPAPSPTPTAITKPGKGGKKP